MDIERRREIGFMGARSRWGKFRQPQTCQHCGKLWKPEKSGRKYCSNECRYAASRGKPGNARGPHVMTKLGPDNGHWKGGRLITSSGHIRIYLPESSLADQRGYALEHRVVWEKAHGPIPAGVNIHHINHDPADNRLENLMMLSIPDHAKLHGTAGFDRYYETHDRKAEGSKAGKKGAYARYHKPA